ncbi:MAG: helix-turn-helix transcriptional regulator [Immundisolibacter sp.]|uniref:helix-turn-helix transcriptional regulator n=1 Tax=Immundisolibacter sp. TaxID=1934948 RepID=UPI003EE0AC03
MIDFTRLPDEALLRSREFLRPGPVPMGRTLWHEMVADGRAPAPAVRRDRLTAWRWSDIRQFLADLAGGEAA